MPARSSRLALAIPLVLALTVLTGGAPQRATAATSFTYDTYFWSAYERQVDSRTCTAASTAMMMNILSGRDRNVDQMGILRYAQPLDALDDSVQRGTDPMGWAKAATFFSKDTIRPTIYRWVAYTSPIAALKRAAIQIARYGKAVGLLVRHGRHAVVMTGFTASRNPLEGQFKLTGVFYSDPMGARHAYVATANAPLDTYREMDATREYDAAWYGKYIVIIPIN